MNPYLILGVPPNADDATIRQAYLEAIKTATPDTDPQRFKEISSAYEQIKDETRRIQYLLFNRDLPGQSPGDTFGQYARYGIKPKPLPMAAMKEYLRSCLKK